MSETLHSARLVYRAAEPTDDEPFIHELQSDPVAWVNTNATLLKAPTKKDAARYIQRLEEALLGLVICLPPTDLNRKPTPIGVIMLKAVPPRMVQHRSTELGIEILKKHQGKGYGSEAINWILDWAFEAAGMHRVSLMHFEYNEGAGKLYQRLGFRMEGVGKEAIWSKGRWWDEVQMAMLSWEWAEIKRKREAGD